MFSINFTYKVNLFLKALPVRQAGRTLERNTARESSRRAGKPVQTAGFVFPNRDGCDILGGKK